MTNNLFTLALVSLKNKDSYTAIKAILNHKDCSHLTKVKFALHCARSVQQHSNNSKEVVNCIELVDRWIKGDRVTAEELTAAANAAANAANATAYAANAAAYAAAYAAANAAAYAAANAANAANLRFLVKLVMLQENREVGLIEALYET